MRLLRSLVLLWVALPLGAVSAGAQARLVRDAELRAVPDGSVIATLQTGTTWGTGPARGGFTRLTIEGWVDATRLGGRRDTFPQTIGGNGTLRIRAEPSLNGRILGVFEVGAGVSVLERRTGWARVRRDGWALTTALARRDTAASAPQVEVDGPVRSEAGRNDAVRSDAAGSDAVRNGALAASAPAPLHLAPGAPKVGVLEKDAIVEPLARDRGWVRIRLEAWVPESLLVPADTAYRASLTAADLRLDPIAFRGRTVRWTVQFVAMQTADPLRRDLAAGEPYLLAMGPSGENAVLYLVVPPSLMAQARALAPLERVVVTARVRTGRSEPTGAPVLDLLSILKR